MKQKTAKDLIVFFDFDNTITTIDVIDDMLGRFSKDDGWKALEEKWQREEIGSRECLKGQVEGIRIGEKNLNDYLKTVEIDPHFKKVLRLLKSRDVPYLIVSDNFDYIVKRILKRNNVADIEMYCNKVDVSRGRLKPSFPFANKKCGDCANCKKTHLLSKRKKGMTAVYVGDGKSDVCASRVSDIVFAKGYLRELFEKEGLPHIAIDGFKDVYDYFVRSL